MSENYTRKSGDRNVAETARAVETVRALGAGATFVETDNGTQRLEYRQEDIDSIRRIHELKDSATEYGEWVGNIDDAASVLVAANKNSENIFIDFNGVKLCSVDATSKEAVLSTYNLFLSADARSTETRDSDDREYLARREAAEDAAAQEALSNVQEWKDYGTTIGLSEQEKAEWDRMVDIRVSDLYHGFELKNAIEIMKALNESNSYEEVESLIDDGHSGASYGMMRAIVSRFHSKGADFFTSISK